MYEPALSVDADALLEFWHHCNWNVPAFAPTTRIPLMWLPNRELFSPIAVVAVGEPMSPDFAAHSASKSVATAGASSRGARPAQCHLASRVLK